MYCYLLIYVIFCCPDLYGGYYSSEVFFFPFFLSGDV